MSAAPRTVTVENACFMHVGEVRPATLDEREHLVHLHFDTWDGGVTFALHRYSAKAMVEAVAEALENLKTKGGAG